MSSQPAFSEFAAWLIQDREGKDGSKEEKCEIQYETVYEEVCEAGAAGAEQCQTVEEQVCTTVEEEQCSTVTENVCETEYGTLTTEECGTELETKCETEVRQTEMREAVR